MSLGAVAIGALILIIVMLAFVVVYSMDPEGRMPKWPVIGLLLGIVAEAIIFVIWLIGVARTL